MITNHAYEYKDIINMAILTHFKCQSHHDDNNKNLTTFEPSKF